VDGWIGRAESGDPLCLMRSDSDAALVWFCAGGWVELFGRRGGGFLGCSVWICMGGGVVSGLMGDGFANARSVGAGGVVWGIVSFWTGSYE
jgi:hypothetical protein